jgi:hypothetical protein
MSSEALENISNTSKQSSTTSSSSQSSRLSRFKKHFSDLKKDWAPLMAAKEHWEDEYTFPPGRYAGQGLQRDL